MSSYLRFLQVGAAVFGFTGLLAAADDAPKVPDRSEIMVPSSQLNVVLAKYPRAVLLSRDQYETLLRDATKTLAPGVEPPLRAVLASARYNGELNGEVLDVQAEFTVNVLSDKWAEVPLRLGALALGDIKVDGDAAFSAGNGAATLMIRGKGAHKITAEFMLPVRKDSGVSSVQLSLPRAGAGLFTFNVPPDTQVESSQPIDLKKNADSTTVSLPLAAQNDVVVSWHGAGDSQLASAVLFQENSYIYSIDETRVQTDLGIVLNTALGNLPGSLQIKIPAGTTPLQVVGNEVLKWTASGDLLTVDLTPGDRKTAGIRVLLETPSVLAPGTTMLPLPEIAGVRRSAGKFVVIGSRGVKIKDIAAGEGAVQAEGIFDNSIEQDKWYVAGYGFAVQPAAIKVSIEKVTPRFSADLDTLYEFKREAIFVERTLALHGEEGEIFESNFVMPAGEELISVNNEDNTEPDWKADGAAVKIRFGEGLDSGGQRVFKIKSRMEPPKWPETDEVTPGDLKIPGAEKINGYLALRADEMFRVETTGAEGLEKRDPRTTPVKGDFAWFRRESFQLHVKLSRRAPEVQAALLGYALPVDGALDVHGQLGFNILYSGVNKLRVKVPAQSAEQFYFDGAQIAERNRDGDTWTIVLQKEITGYYALKFHAVIPFDESQANFHVDIPNVEPLDVKEQAGTWAVEANTSTEVTFDNAGMNELDPLHAPVLPDYQPRHHVIGVYGYLGTQHSLKLNGVKHEAAPILTAVADRLDLDTTVSTSGAERHQAVFYIRTVGDQFLDVTLPAGSNVWSLTVDGQPLKPVSEKPDVVRVQLPATLDRTRATAIQLVYETRRKEWRASGGYSLVAPQLDARIPVLQSHWRVWLPDGFTYTAFDSNLQKEATAAATPLLFTPFEWLKKNLVFRSYARQGAATGAGPHDVNKLLAEAQGFYDSARFDLAYKRYDQVLSLDPSNVAARQGQVRVLEAKNQYANEAYNETRANLSRDVTKRWETAPRKYTNRETFAVTATDGFAVARSTDYIQTKLNRIIIPVLNFNEATVRDAIEFLHRKSVELDTSETDPSRKGVNIVLKLDSVPEGAQSIAERRITVSLSNIPLAEALRYVANFAGLKAKIDPYAVAIVPLSEPTDVFVTKEYTVPPGFLSTGGGAPGATGNFNNTIGSLSSPRSDGPAPAVPAALPTRATALDYLKSAGVVFPEGASANFLPGSNKLVVRNTEDNLDLVDRLVDALPSGQASQEMAGDAAALEDAERGAPVFDTRAPVNGSGIIINGAISGNHSVTVAGAGTVVLGNSAAMIPTAPATPSPSVNNLDMSGNVSLGSNVTWAFEKQKTAGLLPMKLELEHAGKQFSFDGFYAAEKVSFHYVDWWSQARQAWFWWIVGGLLFFAAGAFGAWRRLVWGALLLTFIPICLAPSFTGLCNALLVGWLTGFIIHQIAMRLVFRRQIVEVAAV